MAGTRMIIQQAVLSYKKMITISIMNLIFLCNTTNARTFIVDQKNPHANDAGTATAEMPFKSISPAAALAQPGDTVLVHAGVYRERVTPAFGGEPGKPVVYTAASGEKVIIKGSEVWTPGWRAEPGQPGMYFSKLDSTMFGAYNPYHIDLHHKRPDSARLTLGQIFLDGEPLVEVSSVDRVRQTCATWVHEPKADLIYIHFPHGKSPAHSVVELTTRGRIFAPHRRGLGYIHVVGFIIEHCGNQFPGGFWDSRERAQAGALGCRSGHHWRIENNTIRHAKSIGLDVGSESNYDIEGDQPKPSREQVGYHLIQNNTISDNGACGIAGWAHTGTRIIGNTIERNNNLGFLGWETAGIKVHGFIDGLIEGNLLRDNDSFGIWLDNQWRGARVTRNVCINNLWAGIFVELGMGPVLVDNNIVAYTRPGTAMDTRGGHGFYAHDASGITLAHNLIYCNSNFGVWMHIATDRLVRSPDGERRLSEASHEHILNNMIIGNKGGAISLPFPFERSGNNASDFNLILSGGLSQDIPMFVLNTAGGRVASDSIRHEFSAALDAGNVPRDEWPNLYLWTALPYLTLEQWRFFAKQDRNSRAVKPEHSTLRSRLLEVELAFDESLRNFSCPPVKGVDRDFYGNPLPQPSPLPGPFQILEGGDNRLQIWPVLCRH